MLGALADFPSCPPPGQRSSQCECFTLCLLSTAGLVGSRKLLSSSSSTFKLAVRMTGSSTGADRRAQESVTPSHWTSRGSSWRAHARMVSLRSDKVGLCALGMLQAQLRRQGGDAGHVARCPQLNSWMLSCTSDPCGERDRRTALSSERNFSADGSRREDEDRGAGADAQVCSRTPGPRLHFHALKEQTTRHAQLACPWTAR